MPIMMCGFRISGLSSCFVNLDCADDRIQCGAGNSSKLMRAAASFSAMNHLPCPERKAPMQRRAVFRLNKTKEPLVHPRGKPRTHIATGSFLVNRKLKLVLKTEQIASEGGMDMRNEVVPKMEQAGACGTRFNPHLLLGIHGHGICVARTRAFSRGRLLSDLSGR
jgi:hypothetical protein